MNTARIPLPGAVRWRVMHPLVESDGTCALIYDLERAAVVEVPEELQLHVAPALEMGDLDDELLSWLVNEDLLSSEAWTGWAGELDRGPMDSEDGWSAWAIHRFDGEVRARVSPLSESEVREVLEPVFKQSFGVARVRLLLDWNGTFPAARLIDRVLIEARRMAVLARQEVSFEIVLDSRKLTHAAANFLALSPFHVRLRCGTFPAADAGPVEQRAWTARTAPLFLLSGMMDRIIVQCSLAGGARLASLWSWAKRSGVRHLDATHADLSDPEEILPPALQVREYQQDLLAICDEMVSELEARRMPVEYRPLTRLIRRLMGSEQLIEPASEPEPIWDAGSPAWPDMWAGGDRSGSLFTAFPVEPSGALGAAPDADPDQSPCRSCWARSLCSHSTLLPAFLGDDRREPSPERCPLWLAKAEVALRFYHRLAQCAPADIHRFLGGSERMPLVPLGRLEDLGAPKHLF